MTVWYSRLQKVGIWIWDDLRWFSFFSRLRVWGYSHIPTFWLLLYLFVWYTLHFGVLGDYSGHLEVHAVDTELLHDLISQSPILPTATRPEPQMRTE